MSIDPTDPDTFEAESDLIEIDVEAPEADAAEQHADLSPLRDDRLNGVDHDSANEADRVEQSRIVELNEDEYR
ncbi:hypothetical protein [Kitasatospora sp. NPDC050543]|uniref:hypothetical protein n=1 Tax=Kitasatospora sp. NPDC050543 TaxID=3364054 RepID=UPI00378E0A01